MRSVIDRERQQRLAAVIRRRQTVQVARARMTVCAVHVVHDGGRTGWLRRLLAVRRILDQRLRRNAAPQSGSGVATAGRSIDGVLRVGHLTFVHVRLLGSDRNRHRRRFVHEVRWRRLLLRRRQLRVRRVGGIAHVLLVHVRCGVRRRLLRLLRLMSTWERIRCGRRRVVRLALDERRLVDDGRRLHAVRGRHGAWTIGADIVRTVDGVVRFVAIDGGAAAARRWRRYVTFSRRQRIEMLLMAAGVGVVGVVLVVERLVGRRRLHGIAGNFVREGFDL